MRVWYLTSKLKKPGYNTSMEKQTSSNDRILKNSPKLGVPCSASMQSKRNKGKIRKTG